MNPRWRQTPSGSSARRARSRRSAVVDHVLHAVEHGLDAELLERLLQTAADHLHGGDFRSEVQREQVREA